MSLIDREKTIDSLQTFIDRYIGSTGCKWKEKDEYFIEGIKYAIRSIKLQDEADNDKIRKYIEETGDLSYAHFEDRGEHLSIR